MSKKATILLLITLFLFVSATVFISAPPKEKVIEGSYTIPDFSTSGTFEVSYDPTALIADFQMKLKTSNHPDIYLTRDKVQELINLIDTGVISDTSLVCPTIFENRNAQLQRLNNVLNIFDDPVAFDDLITRVKASGLSANIITETTQFSDHSITVTAETE